MKELTVQEKAEAYDKAIERAKKEWIENLDNCYKNYREHLEIIFPELAESEDEKIRKGILVYIDKATGCERWVAWLEKQGEQKPFDYENANIQQKDFAPKETVKEAESNLTPLERKVKDILFSFHIKAADGISFDGTMAIVHNLITLCQQEQKHAEKKELKKIEQKFNIGDEIKTANEEPLTITKIDEKGYWSEDLFICGFDDTAKWELVGQNSTWSEEDEIIGKELIDFCVKCSQGHTIVNSQDDFRRWTTWLKSLKPQLKNEWSKEDEGEVAVLEAYIRSKDWSESHIDRALGIVDELVNKAKSLIPQNTWKPSEHELEVLKLVAEKDGTCLMGLYKQLKKLREE